ncbi:hypothetical protein D3C73_955610 [compost metagenome]
MGDEQGRRREGDDREAQIGRAEIVAGLLGRVVPAQQRQHRRCNHAPQRQRLPSHPPDAGQQHDRSERRRQHQGGEQRRLGGRPGQGRVVRRRAIQEIKDQPLDQADPDTNGCEPARALERGAAGGGEMIGAVQGHAPS